MAKGRPIREAGIEMTHVPADGARADERPGLAAAAARRRRSVCGARSAGADLRRGRKAAWLRADIYDFEKLLPGNVVTGPAVIHTPITTIVLQDESAGHHGWLSQRRHRFVR